MSLLKIIFNPLCDAYFCSDGYYKNKKKISILLFFAVYVSANPLIKSG